MQEGKTAIIQTQVKKTVSNEMFYYQFDDQALINKFAQWAENWNNLAKLISLVVSVK
jgi:hypothetical protein